MLLASVLRSISIVRVVKMKPQPKVVFVLGGPGAGKGTQCQKIVDNFGYVHLSAGELLREERGKPDSKDGKLIDECINEGTIVPVEITCNLIEKAMDSSGKDKFLIDGFPRNEDNLEGWNKTLGQKVQLQFVLVFDCHLKTCIERCMKRGEEGSGRSDDNLEILEKRIMTFVNETSPIIKKYESLGLVKRVDSGKSVDDVYKQVQIIFQGAANGGGDQ